MREKSSLISCKSRFFFIILSSRCSTCRSFGQIICHILLLFRVCSKVNCLPIFFAAPFAAALYTHNWNKDNFETVVKWKLHGMCPDQFGPRTHILRAPPSLPPCAFCIFVNIFSYLFNARHSTRQQFSCCSLCRPKKVPKKSAQTKGCTQSPPQCPNSGIL